MSTTPVTPRPRAKAAARLLKRAINAEVNHWFYNQQAERGWGLPEVFQIELTNHCPMRCGMCPRTRNMSRHLGYMPVELFKRIIDQIEDTTSKVFLHHFGDSLLHPSLGECIRYARDHDISTYLSANPILLTARRGAELIESGLQEIVLSLDGVTSATSALVRGDAARNVAAAEARVREFLAQRAAYGSSTPYVIMQIVRQKQNEHEVAEWLAKWAEVEGVDRVKVKSYVTWDGQDEFINSLRVAPKLEDTKLVCDKPWTSVTILWDGRVVPCCFDHDGTMVLGDVRTESLRSIWDGEKARYLRTAHRDHSLGGVKLCAQCKDKEGYPVRRWHYPFNRILGQVTPLGSQDDVALDRQQHASRAP